MVDKIFIDSTVRMGSLFQLANRDLFPIQEDAFTLHDSNKDERGVTTWDDGAHCVNQWNF